MSTGLQGADGDDEAPLPAFVKGEAVRGAPWLIALKEVKGATTSCSSSGKGSEQTAALYLSLWESCQVAKWKP